MARGLGRALAVAAGMTPEADRTPEQHAAVNLAAELADELLEADAVLLAVPLYNFGVSQHAKAWFDLVITDPRGQQGPLLKDKPVVLATVRGGAYGAGTPREGWDHSTSHLRRILADVWGADLTVVEREFTLSGSTRRWTTSATWPTRCTARRCPPPPRPAASWSRRPPDRPGGGRLVHCRDGTSRVGRRPGRDRGRRRRAGRRRHRPGPGPGVRGRDRLRRRRRPVPRRDLAGGRPDGRAVDRPARRPGGPRPPT